MIRRFLAATAAAAILLGGWATPSQAALSPAAAGGTITGTISAPGGGPATDFGVYAYPPEGGGSIPGIALGQGRYSLDVPAGQWKIAVETEATGEQFVPRTTRFGDAT